MQGLPRRGVRTPPVIAKESLAAGSPQRAEKSSPSAPGAPRWPLWATLAALVAFGLVLRMFRIDSQSVWTDEAFSLGVSRMPLHELTHRLVADFVHPPLHYYLLHAWFELFGFGSFQARLLSAIFGTLAIVVIYSFACYLFEQRTALLAALLLSVSQLSVMYSQEARPYAQFLFFALGTSYLFVVAFWERSSVAWWSFVGAAVLLVHTHYYGALVLAALLLHGFAFQKRHPLPKSWLGGGIVVALLLCVPWLTSGVVSEALHSSKAHPEQLPPWFAAHWWTFFVTMNDFHSGRLVGLQAPPPVWTFVAGALLFTVPALLALKPLVVRSARRVPDVYRESTALLVSLWLLPMLVVIGAGELNVQYASRYVAVCAAPYYILVGRGISALESRALRRILVAVILVYSLGSLRANYFVPYKENYRDALGYLAEEYREGDCCIFLPFEDLPWAWSVYHADHPGLRVESLDAVTSGRTQCNRVWVTSYRRVPWAVAESNKGEEALLARHLKVKEARYFWMNVGLFVPRQ
jgi:mannosyltransferase